MLNINVQYPLWRPYKAYFDKLNPHVARQILRSVGRRVDSSALSSMKRSLKASGYTIKGPAVKKYSKITTKVTGGSVTIKVKGGRVPAMAFKTKPSKFVDTTGNRRRPVDVMFKQRPGWLGLKNGFMWESPQGAQLMFERTTSSRMPIREVNYDPIPKIIADDEVAKDTIMNDVFDTIVKRFEYELNRRWGK